MARYEKFQYFYDNSGRLSELISYTADNGSWYYDYKLSYTYDNSNNINSITKSLFDYNFSNSWYVSNIDSFFYDNLNREIAYYYYYIPNQSGFIPYLSTISTYDANGNIDYIKYFRWTEISQGYMSFAVTGEDSLFYHNDNTIKTIIITKYTNQCGGGVLVDKEYYNYIYTYNNSGDLISKKCSYLYYNYNNTENLTFNYSYDQWHNSVSGTLTNNWSIAEPNIILSLELYSDKNQFIIFLNTAL